MNDVPNPLGGNHPLAAWLNKMRLAVIARTPLQVPNTELQLFRNGFFYKHNPGKGTTTAGASSTVGEFRIKQVFYDVYRCRTWIAGSEGSADVYVAKNHKLRNSVASEVIENVTFSYLYHADYVHRTSVQGSNNEAQEIVPPIIASTNPAQGDIIMAVKIPTTTLTRVLGDTAVSVQWQDLNLDGRAWSSEIT